VTSAAGPAYVAAVLLLYLDLPETPMRATAADHAFARKLQEEDVALPLVEAALLLASLRRLIRPADRPRLSPIRSLAYFHPVIIELQQQPLPDAYLDYLRLRFRDALKLLPNHVQKNTFPDER
jgi:hypothetical protein